MFGYASLKALTYTGATETPGDQPHQLTVPLTALASAEPGCGTARASDDVLDVPDPLPHAARAASVSPTSAA